MDEGEIEKVVISVTPDIVKPKETVRRNSTGKLDTKTSPALSSSDDKLPPHYLRASTSSCHEHCKYGTKHVFDVKKRNPKFRRYSVNNDIQHEEQGKAKISTLRVRRKSTKLELKSTHPKDENRDIPDVVKLEVQKDNLLSDKNKNLEEESYEESESIKLLAPSSFQESKMSLDHRPVSEGEGLFDTLKNLEEESDSIKQMTPSQFHESIASLEGKPSSESEGLSGRPIGIRTVNLSPRHQLDMPDDPEAIELETPSPVEKNIISHVPTPLTWSEGSSDGSVSMESEIQSPTHTPLNPVEEISEEFLGVEVVTAVEINESTDEPHIITASAPKRLKPKTSLTTRKSVASAKLTSTGRAEKTTGWDSSVKLKGSSTTHQSSACNKKQTGMKSLKTVEGKKREVMKLKADLSRGKTEVTDRDEAGMEKKNEVTVKPGVIKKSNPAEETKTPDNPKSAEAKIPSPIKGPIKGPITSTSPRIMNIKVSSPVKSTEVPAGFSLSPKFRAPMAKSTPAIVSSPINIKKKGSSPLKRIDAPAGSSTAPKLKTSTEKSTPALILSERLPIQRSQENKMIGSRYQSESTHEKVLKPSRASLSPKTTASGVSSMKSTKYRSSTLSTPLESRAKIGKLECTSDKVKEPKIVKTAVKAIKTPNKNIRRSSSTTFSLSSSSSSSSVSSHVKEDHDDDECRPTGANDPVFNGKETKRETPVKSLKTTDKQRPRRTTTVHTGDKQPSSQKLNFRRGKVVSPKAENNAARKLRFRPRVVKEKENGKEALKRRSFRIRRRASIGSVADLIAHKSEASSVVLRHRGMQGKKEVRGLLNPTDDKHLSPHKLSFLRGKVASPQSENNGPKKLRFRARVANENPSGKEVSRRSYRRRGSIGSVTDLVTPSSDAPPVVLRHQDVQEKKEAQGLFNHVIEETASKLVETRKSKVKALVGAFETVISLQESRSTPTAKVSVPY